MTRDQAIEFLKGYRTALYEINALERAIAETRSGVILPSHPKDGMPKGHDLQDLSAYAARIDKLERQLAEKKKEAVNKREKIVHVILALDKAEERAAMLDHYINGIQWADVALAMNYSERQMYYFREHAISCIRKKL